MESLLLVVSGWWWIAPAAAGAGAAGYTMITTNRRRARRLELDAARHELSLSYQQLQHAKARVRTAQADLLSAKANQGAVGAPGTGQARAALSDAKRAVQHATMALRTARSRVKAANVQYHSAAGDAPLPIETVMAEHDAVTARWLPYETDAARALAFPQMLDAQHPATHAFLVAQREAAALRPASARDRVTPPQFLAYRAAVRQAAAAFEAAEADAQRTARGGLPAMPWRGEVPASERPRDRPATQALRAARDAIRRAVDETARAIDETARTVGDTARTVGETARSVGDAARSGDVPPWPIPSRTRRTEED